MEPRRLDRDVARARYEHAHGQSVPERRGGAMSSQPKHEPRARLLDITPADYHLDPCVTPSLSSSIAHTLVTKSPLHAWTEHPRFGALRSESSKAQDEGSIIHKLLLGK